MLEALIAVFRGRPLRGRVHRVGCRQRAAPLALLSCRRVTGLTVEAPGPRGRTATATAHRSPRGQVMARAIAGADHGRSVSRLRWPRASRKVTLIHQRWTKQLTVCSGPRGDQAQPTGRFRIALATDCRASARPSVDARAFEEHRRRPNGGDPGGIGPTAGRGGTVRDLCRCRPIDRGSREPLDADPTCAATTG
jgi:hypothetical protein